MGVLHVKLSEVSLQQAGRRLLGLQGRGLPTNAQDPKTDTFITLCCCFAFFLHYVSSSVYTGAHLRAIERTLVLFLTRCRTAEFELEAGTEESV